MIKVSAAGQDATAPVAHAVDGNDVDHLVPDPVVWRELGITAMTGWRYTRDPNLNFPPAIQIRGRNFRSRKMIEAWKRRMMQRAIAARGGAS